MGSKRPNRVEMERRIREQLALYLGVPGVYDAATMLDRVRRIVEDETGEPIVPLRLGREQARIRADVAVLEAATPTIKTCQYPIGPVSLCSLATVPGSPFCKTHDHHECNRCGEEVAYCNCDGCDCDEWERILLTAHEVALPLRYHVGTRIVCKHNGCDFELLFSGSGSEAKGAATRANVHEKVHGHKTVLVDVTSTTPLNG